MKEISDVVKFRNKRMKWWGNHIKEAPSIPYLQYLRKHVEKRTDMSEYETNRYHQLIDRRIETFWK